MTTWSSRIPSRATTFSAVRHDKASTAAMSDADTESPAQRSARLRREKRNAKIQAEGSDRLARITQLSGRPAPAPEERMSHPTTQAKRTVVTDPLYSIHEPNPHQARTSHANKDTTACIHRGPRRGRHFRALLDTHPFGPNSARPSTATTATVSIRTTRTAR